MRTITPISAAFMRKSVSPISPKQLGPSSRPAIRAPTTCGMLTFSLATPKTFVESRIIAIAIMKL